MEKLKLKDIFTKKTSDYTFAILFLMIFSGFIMFAIRPSITTAFSLKKEETDLDKIDKLYESKIMDIASIQSQIEDNREDLHLLDDAVSQYPEVNKMVEDIKTIADKNNFSIKKANIADVDLTVTKKNIDKVSLVVEGKTNFDDFTVFMNDLHSQRRLKTVNKVIISRDLESTGSGSLRVVITIDGYYL
jgi:Tfp pilus assembly protein PilO